MISFRLSLLLCLLITCQSWSSAQESTRYLKFEKRPEYIKGHILKNDSSQEEGLIRVNVLNKRKLHSKITFISKDGEKSTLVPGDILGFSYQSYRYITVVTQFYLVLHEGPKVSLYKRLIKREQTTSYGADGSIYGMPIGLDYEFYLKKADSDFYKLFRPTSYEKELAEYFKDCPESVKHLEDLPYEERSFINLVMQYNHCQEGF